MNYFKKILKDYALKYKKYAILNVICNVFYALFGTLAFVALMPVLTVLFDKTQQLDTKPVWTGILDLKDYMKDYLNYYVTTTLEGNPEQALIMVIAMVVIMFLLKNIFSYLGMYFLTFLRNGVLRDLRNDMYEKTVALPISYYSEKRKGDVMSRVIADVQLIQASYVSVLEMAVKEPLNIIFTLIMMLLWSPQLTLFVFIFLPLGGYLISLIGKSLKKKSIKVQTEQGNILSNIEESLSGLKVIKGFNAEQVFFKKFSSSTQRFYKFSNSLLNRTNLAGPTSEFLGIALIAVLLWFGGRLVLIDGTMDGAFFLTYMALAYNILTPVKAISKAIYKVKNGDGAAERVLEVLELENPIVDAVDAVQVRKFAKAVKLDNITFSYGDGNVLKNFNLEVPKGTSVALVGQSGSGKSTIASLIPRFYDVNNGSITVDGIDIRRIGLSSLRDLMGLVTQDSILFNASIRENITMGKDGYSDAQVIDALKIANAWEFVVNLPKGIETNIGDSGNRLSGGQKQRLSIARAVLKNPPIMILDEATSALDTESEKLVQDALENMMKNRTSIVIAHRLSTIQNADLIVVMKDGEIVEQGTHNQLLEKKTAYHNLVMMQSFD